MQMMKKIAACVSAGLLLTSFSATMASAASVSGDNMKASASDYAAYTRSLTKEDKAAIAAKEAACKKLAAKKVQTGEAASLTRLKDFVIYKQEKDNFCGPACVKSALRFLTGSSPSQTTIDKSIKKNIVNVPAYMNARQNKAYYILAKLPSNNGVNTTELKTRIGYDINDRKIPSFMRIDGTTSSNWYYATDGHCILATGIYTDGSKIQIADPLGNRLPGCPYFYIKDVSTVARFATHLVW